MLLCHNLLLIGPIYCLELDYEDFCMGNTDALGIHTVLNDVEVQSPVQWWHNGFSWK